ncbi:hypothetical protein HWV62_14134 [Athelia sp. TMB]|nr:hypothetical protein HWV62_14134 [Athelia sp. TMB]
MACRAAVLVIVLDLSFFIWDKAHSRQCFKEALLIYEQADANHKAVMAAVQEACAAKEGESEEDMAVFIKKMKEIVLAHRLCELTKAAADSLLIFPPQRRATEPSRIRDETGTEREKHGKGDICRFCDLYSIIGA